MKQWSNIISAADKRGYSATDFGLLSGLGGRSELLTIGVHHSTGGTSFQAFRDSVKAFSTSCCDVAWKSTDKIKRLLLGSSLRLKNRPTVFFETVQTLLFQAEPKVSPASS